MPTYILMNQAQANQVRGQTTAGHAFAPVPVPNTNPQTFAAPIECKTDPYHQDIKSLLDTFTTVTTAPVGPHSDTVLVQKCTFNDQTWLVGIKIQV